MISRNIHPVVPADSKWSPPERNYMAGETTRIYCELLVAIPWFMEKFRQRNEMLPSVFCKFSTRVLFIAWRKCNFREAAKRSKYICDFRAWEIRTTSTSWRRRRRDSWRVVYKNKIQQLRTLLEFVYYINRTHNLSVCISVIAIAVIPVFI